MKKYINILFASVIIFGFAACSTNFEEFGNTDYVDNQDYTGQAYTTVSFPGNPTCYGPDIRYVTCVLHGDKVKARIHTGKATDGIAGNRECTVVFDLPDQTAESGVIEFTANLGTDATGTTESTMKYHAKWTRKRYDVRISEILTDAAYQAEQSESE